jgi:omega-6 fatty acid desaturase (delta-12 desaturase)
MKGIKKILARIFREPFIYFFITIPFIWFFGLFYVVAKRYGIFSWSFLEKILSIVLFVWILPAFGIPAYTLWVVDYLSQVLGTFVFHMEHSVNPPYRARNLKWSFERAALEGSTFLDVPRLFKSFTCGIEYHHIHHLNTNVPSY